MESRYYKALLAYKHLHPEKFAQVTKEELQGFCLTDEQDSKSPLVHIKTPTSTHICIKNMK